jgi:hypothetical protein
MLATYNDDTVNWAFSSKAKDKNIADSDDGNGIVHIDSDIITLDIPLTVQNMSSFLQGMKLKYNDGNGTRDIVTFLGVDFIDNMQLKCNIRLSDDSTKLIDPEMLDFIENPDIAIIPQTSEEYCSDATSLNPSDLEHILKLITLSPFLEEMLSYYYWLHHEPFPGLLLRWKKAKSQNVLLL